MKNLTFQWVATMTSPFLRKTFGLNSISQNLSSASLISFFLSSSQTSLSIVKTMILAVFTLLNLWCSMCSEVV
jgi:hypothetical protein